MIAIGICRRLLQSTRFAVGLAVGCLLLVLSPHAVAAQMGIVVGTVTDRGTGQPVEGARAQVGTFTAAATDARGRFILRAVPVGTQAIRVTRIGYRPAVSTATVPAGDTVRVSFDMTISAIELDQVVVTGTGGAVEKRRIGTSMGNLNMTQLQEQLPITDLGQALSAKIPGLRSVSVGGGAGASKDLRIRGIASFSLNQRPVVYIDGVRADTRATEWTDAAGIGGKLACCSFAGGTSTDRLNDINPEDIDRVEVLKGAAAATLYGSEATNGVIQIFTKRGKNDSRSQWAVGATTGYDRLRENLPTKLFPRFTGPDGTRAHDSNDLIGSGPYQNYDVSVQGGGNRSTYFASGGYLDQEGSIQPNWERRGSLRLNLTFLPTDKWTIEGRSMYTKNRVAELQGGNNWTALLGNAMNGDPRKASAARPYGEAWVPVSDIRNIDTFSDASRWTGGVTLSFAPRSNFTHRFTTGLDVVNEQKERFFPFLGDYGAAGVTNGSRNLGFRNYYTATVDYLGLINFRLPFNVGSDFSFGAQYLRDAERLNVAVGNTFAAPGVTVVSAGAVTQGGEAFAEKINLGYLAQNRFSFGDKLFATLGLRIDGNSSFGEDFGYKQYPKADVAWVLSEYGILPSFVSSMKLRAAVGDAGKAPGAFDKFTTFASRSVLQGTPGVLPDNPGNADLRPETTRELESGFEAGFLHDRIGIDASIYWAFTRDAIVQKPNAPSEGYSSPRRVNIGRVDNHGWEASLNILAISTHRFDWTTNLRADGNENKVIGLGGVKLAGNNVREGYPVRGVWARVPTGFSVVNGQPITTRSDTAVYFGAPLPTFNGSFGNTIRFGSFTLYSLLTMERGAWFSNGDRPYRVRQGGADEYLQFLDAQGKPTFAADSVLQYWSLLDAIDSRDNVRLREISLTYAMPEALSGRLRLGRTQITVSGQNVNWWDHCHCVDPNMNYAGGDSFLANSGFLAQPAPRSFRVAIRTRF
jgi:TonB-dependent SusC/RagA subfamily outer membrane receptor